MRYIEGCLVCGSPELELSIPGNYTGGADQAHRYFLSNRERTMRGDVHRCRACGFKLTSPQFSPEEYDAIYSRVADQDDADADALKVRYQYLAGRLRQQASGGRLLDFGCGGGGFLTCAPEFDAFGFEVSSNGDIWDGNIYRGALETARRTRPEFADQSFDVITAWDVLEHLPEIDRDVAALHALLKPGGVFVFSVPNVASLMAKLQGPTWNSYLLEHIWYFDPATIDRYLAARGFEKRSLRPIGFPASLGILGRRVKQTFGLPLPIPAFARRTILTFPIGLMLGAYSRV
jgi:2-polyprenyl-3-methyl-5-hydroxy-6-metoxy-1,4-benzoquinol methylase